MVETKTTHSGQPDRADQRCLAILAVVMILCIAPRWYYDNWLSDHDLFTFFLHNFEFVGDQLREWRLPLWQPYEAGGAPGIGNPSNGWMHGVVMFAFTAFEPLVAIKVVATIHTLLAGFATYAFCRVIGLVPIAALLSALAFGAGTTLYASTTYVAVLGLLLPYVALGILAAELALRTDRRPARLGWAVLVSFCIVQMFAAWPSQGAAYGVAYILGWCAYRTFIALPFEGETRKQAFWRGVEVVGVAVIVAAGLGAAVILPVLSVTDQSSIAGGNYDRVIGGDYMEILSSWPRTLRLMIQDYGYYRFTAISGAVLLLGLIGIVTGFRRLGGAFFAIAAFLCIDLNVDFSLTRWFFYLIPGVERVHSHRPEGSLWMATFAFAILAGIGLNQLLVTRVRSNFLFQRQYLLIGVLIVLLITSANGTIYEWPAVTAIILAGLLIGLLELPIVRIPNLPRLRIETAVAVGLVLLVVFFPNATDITQTIFNQDAYEQYEDMLGKTPEVQEPVEIVMGNEIPTGVAPYLLRQQQVLQPFRIATYHGLFNKGRGTVNSSQIRLTDDAIAILANAMPTRLGLEQVSSYNPVHLKYYAEYIAFLNHMDQDYHWLDVNIQAISGSQLLDMLNVRYITVPSWEYMNPIAAAMGEPVYQDDAVTLYENPNAFPRAWVVHDVQDNGTSGLGLFKFQQNHADGRVTAFINGDMPQIEPAVPGAEETALVTGRTLDSITFSVSAQSAGLMVASEVYTDGWNAYVDGEKTEVIRTNHALRGVAIPAGEHEVVMKYEPREVTIGLWTTGITAIAMIGIWVWAASDRYGKRTTRPVQTGKNG